MAKMSQCPFCNSGDVQVRSYQHEFRVGCGNCRALGPVGATRELAIRLWSLWQLDSMIASVGPSETKGEEPLEDEPPASASGRLYFGG